MQVAIERAKNVSSGEAPTAEEIARREEAAKKLPPLDAYNNSLVMPLHEFIEHPVVLDLLHNGGAMQVRSVLCSLRPSVCNPWCAAIPLAEVKAGQYCPCVLQGSSSLASVDCTAEERKGGARSVIVGVRETSLLAAQVLGVTNYSHWPEAHTVRRCAQEDPLLQRKLTRAAEKRLRRFLHVGLMERLDDSIASLSVRHVVRNRLCTRLIKCRIAAWRVICWTIRAFARASAGAVAGSDWNEAGRPHLEGEHTRRLQLRGKQQYFLVRSCGRAALATDWTHTCDFAGSEAGDERD